MTDIRDPNNKNPEITSLAEHNDVPSPSASKAQEQLTDEEIHIKDVEDTFHNEDDEHVDEEFDIEW